MLTIHPPSVHEHESDVRLSADIEVGGAKKTLWYSFDRRFLSHVSTDRLDAFLVGLLPLGMARGKGIRVNGPVSEKLLFNLRNSFMPVATLNNPSLQPVEIVADSVTGGPCSTRPQGVVTGFSGGVDSFCAVRDHFVDPGPSRYRLTHLIFNNVGSHGEFDAEAARSLFHVRFELIRELPEAMGLELIKVDSNLSDLLNMNFQQTHIPRNTSCVLLFGQLFGKYYYSSSVHYRDAHLRPSRDMCRSEAASVHLLSNETLECILTGGRYTRVEKTEKACGVKGVERFLNVCVRPGRDGRNCSVCPKCCRTLFTLELLGEVERFGEVFDLDAWSGARTKYLTRYFLRRTRSPLVKEMREYASRTGHRFPAWQRAVGIFHSLIPRRKDPEVVALRSFARRWKRILAPGATGL